MKLGPEPAIDPSAVVENCRLGAYTEIGPRTSLIEVELGDYSYIVNDGEVIYTRIGKFCSIAAQVRINPGDHPMSRISQHHFTYRASAYFDGAEDEAAFFDWRRSRPVSIGHDVWIGHGAIILAGRSVDNGAVIGAGAVVASDVPAYAIVAGVRPSRSGRALRPSLPRASRRLAGGTGITIGCARRWMISAVSHLRTSCKSMAVEALLFLLFLGDFSESRPPSRSDAIEPSPIALQAFSLSPAETAIP